MTKKPRTPTTPPPPAPDLPPADAVNPPRIGPLGQGRPDERKEGGPDYGQEREQWEHAAEEARDAEKPPPAKPRR